MDKFVTEVERVRAGGSQGRGIEGNELERILEKLDKKVDLEDLNAYFAKHKVELAQDKSRTKEDLQFQIKELMQNMVEWQGRETVRMEQFNQELARLNGNTLRRPTGPEADKGGRESRKNLSLPMKSETDKPPIDALVMEEIVSIKKLFQDIN